jgi:hypothetical protein
MTADDPLYVKITNDLRPGAAPISVQDATERWGYSEGHTRRVMDWMAEQQQPHTMRRLPDSSPHKWERI